MQALPPDRHRRPSGLRADDRQLFQRRRVQPTTEISTTGSVVVFRDGDTRNVLITVLCGADYLPPGVNDTTWRAEELQTDDKYWVPVGRRSEDDRRHFGCATAGASDGVWAEPPDGDSQRKVSELPAHHAGRPAQHLLVAIADEATCRAGGRWQVAKA